MGAEVVGVEVVGAEVYKIPVYIWMVCILLLFSGHIGSLMELYKIYFISILNENFESFW